MTCRDRTAEFLSAVKSIQTRQPARVSPPQKREYRSDFSQIAKRIAGDIGNTYAKLEKLTILAKSKSLFNDSSVEIQELTYIIKEDIASLNRQIAQLQELVKSRRGSNRTQLNAHSSAVVVSLQTRLANMSSNFKTVLKTRTESLRRQKERRDQFAQSPVASRMVPSASGTGICYQTEGGKLILLCVALLRDDPSYARHRGDVKIDMGGDGSQMQVLEQQEEYIKERAATMESIESTIVELGGIFQQLATMVKEQEEHVLRIDANVEDAEMNVEAAHSEILKYFHSVSSNRWLIIKIFVVLIVFFIIFVVFMT
ncbi:syntaxin-5-like isoform X2 [Corticium candelabrum]|uniref:syntaxin-5-like isoform X2 n=1 Tax=Corticium candelabrum TaxID=121492 RepID=UPI002E26FE4E|nr:syntaxin-5-like isoform X2 [Corticium candelabrum]